MFYTLINFYKHKSKINKVKQFYFNKYTILNIDIIAH